MAQHVLTHPHAHRQTRRTARRTAADAARAPRSADEVATLTPWTTTTEPAADVPVVIEVVGAPLRTAADGRDHDRPRAEVVVASAALDDVELLRSAARADAVRIRFSAALPNATAVRTLVAVLEGHVLAVGRRREDVRLVLEVETVVARDEADAARRRSWLAHVEAFAGASWAPSASWVVAPRERVVADGVALARHTGVDVVALALVGSSRGHAEQLSAAALAA